MGDPKRVDSGSDKSHPHLPPWEQLTHALRQRGYASIDQIPRLLAMLGYRKERMPTTNGSGARLE